MIHLILASHATLAKSMLETAKMVCGPELIKDVQAFCMTEDKNPEEFLEEVQKYVDQDPEGEYFTMVDLYAASPCTTCVRVLGHYNYRLVTGLNLGMFIEVLLNRDSASLTELEEKAINAGKEGVGKFYIHV